VPYDSRSEILLVATDVTLTGDVLWTKFGNYNIKTHRYGRCQYAWIYIQSL